MLSFFSKNLQISSHLPDQHLWVSSTSIGQQAGSEILSADLVFQKVLVRGIVQFVRRTGDLVAGRVGYADVQTCALVIFSEQHQFGDQFLYLFG